MAGKRKRSMHSCGAAGEMRTIADLIGGWQRRHDGDAVLSVDAEGKVLACSYAKLSADVLRLARGLRASGLGDGAPVVLWAPNGTEWIVTYFAIVAGGGIVVPMDDQATEETLNVALRDTPPERVFTTAAHCAALRAAGLPEAIPCHLFDAAEDDPSSWRRAAAADASAELPALEPTRVATILYTSGTTGTPKGVPLTHENLMSNVRALLAEEIVDWRDRLLLPLPLHHGYPATVGMLFVLACGASIVLPHGISGPELTAAARNARTTVLIGVPRLYKVLVDSIEAGVRDRGFAGRSLFPLLFSVASALRRRFDIGAGRWLFRGLHRRVGPRLRILVSGGARLEPELAAKLEGLGWLVLTGYGLTETSPIVSFNTPRRRRLDSQGVPVSGVEVRMDRKGKEPQGEILVRGPNVFSGYWHDEAATGQAFTGDGWFRTNDLGFLDEDGFLHVLGRRSEVLVLSDGKKISPEELEKVYESSRYIREVGLLERSGTLAAIVVPDEEALRARGTMSQPALLKDELDRQAQRLPGYQRVSEFRLARQPLPRTRLGKLRRHLLPDIFSRAAGRAAPEAKETEERLLESEVVRAVWSWLSECYADRGVSMDSSPQLDLGIDSLAWMSLTAELEERFHVTLSTESLSQVLSVRDLLEAVEHAAQGLPAAPAAVKTGRLKPEDYLEAPPPVSRVLFWIIVLLLKLLARVLFRLRVEGREHLPERGPMVLAPNHASFLDAPALAAALPWRVIDKTCWAGWIGIMHRSRIRRFVSRAGHVFPVDPDRDLGAGIRLGAKALERELNLVWFPEGRRSADGEVQAFRRGIGVLLEQARAPAVPVRIAGSFDAWPVGRMWPRLRPITVRFGSPAGVEFLLAEGSGDEPAARIADGLERRLRAL